MTDIRAWCKVGTITREVSRIEDRNHTPWERVSDATVQPFSRVRKPL